MYEKDMYICMYNSKMVVCLNLVWTLIKNSTIYGYILKLAYDVAMPKRYKSFIYSLYLYFERIQVFFLPNWK